MIEYNLMQLLQQQDKFDMTYSVNFAGIKDDIVTVYSSAGEQPSTYEGVLSKPRYQVIVKSSDYDKAAEIAFDIFDTLHNLQNVVMNVDLKTKSIPYRVYIIKALHEPALIGADDDGIIEYSLNFETELIRLKEHQ